MEEQGQNENKRYDRGKNEPGARSCDRHKLADASLAHRRRNERLDCVGKRRMRIQVQTKVFHPEMQVEQEYNWKEHNWHNQDYRPTGMDVRGQFQHYDKGNHDKHTDHAFDLGCLVERAHADVVIESVDLGDITR